MGIWFSMLSSQMNAFLLREPSRKFYTVSPILFLLYINDFMIRNSNFNVFKYADDMGLAGLLQKDYINDSGVYVGIYNLYIYNLVS